MKKRPLNEYVNESGRKINIIGLRIAEGGERVSHKGCVVFDYKGKLKSFKPLNSVSDNFMEWFIKRQNIKLCKLYYQPYNFKRTGCKGCPFSLDLQEQLETMELYLPNERKQCELLWKPVYDEYRRIGYRLKKNENMKLF